MLPSLYSFSLVQLKRIVQCDSLWLTYRIDVYKFFFKSNLWFSRQSFSVLL